MLREVLFAVGSKGFNQFLLWFAIIAGFVKGFVEEWR
jgi:hypothetical protein